MVSSKRQAYQALGFKYTKAEIPKGYAPDSRIEYNRMIGTKYGRTFTSPARSRKHRGGRS
jgi:hypothetical protein